MNTYKCLRALIIFLIIVGWIFSGWPRIWQNPAFPPKIQEARANTTGEVLPTLGEGVSEAPWSDNGWNTSTNIYTDDGNTASVTAANYDDGDQTYVLKATGFDFNVIPDGSTIDGVIVRINTWYANGGVSIDLAQLLDTSKARVGDNKYLTPEALATPDTSMKTAGGAADTWGNALDSAWVKSANFGVGLGFLATPVKDSDVFVDYVTIEVYYTPPTNNPPTGAINSAAQKTDGTGKVDISIEVDDPNDDDTCKAKVEYKAGADCSSGTSDPTLDESAGATADNPPAPDVENDNTYQVGSVTPILTSPGQNTVTFDWSSATDVPAADGTYCIKLTVNDGTVDQTTPATTTLTLDNVAPTAPGNLTDGGKTTSSITLTFGSQTTETNFQEYKIFYKAGISGVTESDTPHTDSDLGYIDYNSTADTTVSGLTANTDYVFNIWAYDTYGHKANATEVTIKTAAAPTLTFSISANAVDFGALSKTAPRFATTNASSGGSASETIAHTLSASTNASSGYIITVKGATLTHTVNGSFTISAITPTAVDVTLGGSIGTEQFGIRMTKSGTGTVTSPYDGAANFYVYNGTATNTSQVASGTGDGTTTTFSVYYAANISTTTEAGTYTTALTYICTGNF